MKSWKEITWGGLVMEPGSSVAYETGDWRSSRPILDEEKCSNCLVCWVFCPDGAIQVENSKVVGIDLKHCKGCGICAEECPRKAITMVDECEAKAEALK
ncbi:MAG: 4Fe-4S binding protein [Dehalococcoidia bacterium]|jgi:pyruvate ferredoxin oxidoreductase delta subunit|nr:4Fe-4S binding protein [Chloroflexota bacterium]MCK4242951.1 4Fe-4S binding protein [Dehalococcoidia bacterium]